MKIKVNVKKIGRKKAAVQEAVYEIGGRPSTVRELILAVTESCAGEYNRRLRGQASGKEGCEPGRWESSGEEPGREIAGLFGILSPEEIEDKARTGKVGFGVNYGGKPADIVKAQENAIQCFEDGIYRIFMDDKPLEELDEVIQVTEEQVFTFVRLTMLAGRMW